MTVTSRSGANRVSHELNGNINSKPAATNPSRLVGRYGYCWRNRPTGYRAPLTAFPGCSSLPKFHSNNPRRKFTHSLGYFFSGA